MADNDDVFRDDSENTIPDNVFNNPDNHTISHLLASAWTLWFDDPSKLPSNPTEADYSNNLKKVYTFNTVEDFWKLMNTIKSIADCPGCNFHLFKDGVKPMWEDKANAKGGQWSYSNNYMPDLESEWHNTMLVIIGALLDENTSASVNGTVLSLKKKRIQIWVDNTVEEEVMEIGKKYKELLNLKSKIDFQARGKQAASRATRAYLKI